MSRRHDYYVVSGFGWFCVNTRTAKLARSIGVREFGRGNVHKVRRATTAETAEYLRWKGMNELTEDEMP